MNRFKTLTSWPITLLDAVADAAVTAHGDDPDWSDR